MAYFVFSNISNRLWFFNQRNLSSFHSGLQKTKFSIMDNTVWPISSIQKKKIIKLRSNCVVLLKTFIQKLYVLNHIVLSSILYEFLRKALFFSLSSSKAVFFSLFTPFEINLNQGEYGLTYIFLFKKMINFCQKHVWFELRLYFHFMFNGSFFHFHLKYSRQMLITADNTGSPVFSILISFYQKQIWFNLSCIYKIFQ